MKQALASLLVFLIASPASASYSLARPKTRIGGLTGISPNSRWVEWGQAPETRRVIVVVAIDCAVEKPEWTYDLANRVLTETNPLNQTTTLTYDAAGRLATKRDGNNQLTTFERNDNGWQTAVVFSDGTRNDFAFDARGNRTLEKNATHERALHFDELNRLSQVDDVTLGRTILNGFDERGNRTSITEGGVTQRFAFDKRNLLASAQSGSSPLINVQHDALGRRTAVLRPNGVRSDWAFDDASQVTSITHSKGGATLLGFSYENDARGMRTRKTREDGSYEAYLFDDALRLTEVRYSNGRIIGFVLDAWGNRFDHFDSSRPTNQTWRYTANAFNQTTRVQVTSTNFTDYAFDANGNTLTETKSAGAGGGVTTYGWNRENRLTSVSTPAGVTLNQYGANGLRTQRIDASGTTNYLLDGSSVLAELDGSGVVTTRYLNNPESIDDVFAHETASGTVYPLTDALGSVYALTDNTGALVRAQSFEVFGERTSSTGTGPTTDRGFAGRWLDGSGVEDNRARYYLPRLGNFLSSDRAGMIDGPNLYGYGHANPVVNTDPSGKFSFGAGSPSPTWKAAPREDDDLFRIEVEYAAQRALVLLGSPRCRAAINSSCAALNVDKSFNEALAQDLWAGSQVWRLAEADFGDSLPPLGVKPYRVAFSFAYRGFVRDFAPVDPATRQVARDRGTEIQQLTRTVIHEWMHHFLKFGHPKGFSPDLVAARAADPVYQVAETCAP